MKYALPLFCLLGGLPCGAAVPLGLSEVLAAVQKKVKIPVLFPRQLKASQEPYFVTSEVPDGSQYRIYISPVPQCTAHVCQVGLLWGQAGGKPLKAEKVKVGHRLGYYTPAHTAATFVDPSLQWYEGTVLYTLWWKGATKEELIDMATSMKLRP